MFPTIEELYPRFYRGEPKASKEALHQTQFGITAQRTALHQTDFLIKVERSQLHQTLFRVWNPEEVTN